MTTDSISRVVFFFFKFAFHVVAFSHFKIFSVVFRRFILPLVVLNLDELGVAFCSVISSVLTASSEKNVLPVTERAMKRKMLEVSFFDHMDNVTLHQ